MLPDPPHTISRKTIPLHLCTVKADLKGITAGHPSKVRKRLEMRKHFDLICSKDESLFLFYRGTSELSPW